VTYFMKEHMNLKARVGIALILALCAIERVDTASPEPRFGRDMAPSPSSSALPTLLTGSVEEPRGVITLAQVLELTLLKNPELVAFSFEQRAAEARALQAGVLPNPTLGLELEDFGGTGQTKGVRSAQTTLQLSQLIELGGKRAKRLRLADFERALAGWDYEAKRLEVLAEATKAFIEVLATAERLALAQELVGLSQQVFRTVSERVKAGKVSPIEETRARVAVATIRLQAEQARGAFETARKRLAASWGSTAPAFARVEGALETSATIPSEEQLANTIAKTLILPAGLLKWKPGERRLPLPRVSVSLISPSVAACAICMKRHPPLLSWASRSPFPSLIAIKAACWKPAIAWPKPSNNAALPKCA
jgi:outer membrane protein, heavy metal efflux system